MTKKLEVQDYVFEYNGKDLEIVPNLFLGKTGA